MRNRVWRDFSGGALYDTPAWNIRDGAVADARNFLLDRPPMARRRQKATSGGGIPGVSYRLGRFLGSDGSTVLYTFGRQTSAGPKYVPGINDWTPGGTENAIWAGSGSTSSAPRFRWAEPVMHLGALISCTHDVDPAQRNQLYMVGVGGATHASPAGGGGTVNVVVTAGRPEVTITGLTGAAVGHMIRMGEHAASSWCYIGRIAAMTSPSELLVEPVPTVGFTGLADFAIAQAMPSQPGALTPPYWTGGKVLVSWQNRLVAFNIRVFNTATSSAVMPLSNAFAWTIAPDELPSLNQKATGNYALLHVGWEPKNYDYIGSARAITAATVATNGNYVLVFTETETFVLTGFLTSQTASGAGAQYDTPRLSTAVGCLANRTICDTPIGVVWASSEGVYGFDGRIRSLMDGRMSRTWRHVLDLSLGPEYAVHGACYADGHYLVTIAAAAGGFTTFICNLQTLAWSTLSGSMLDLMHAVTSPQKTYALRYWDVQSESGSSVYAKTPPITCVTDIFADADDGGPDADGTPLTASLTTGSDSENLADYEGYRQHRVGYRTAATTLAAPGHHLVIPQGGVDARLPTSTDQNLPLDAGTGFPQVSTLSRGQILDRSISERLELTSGARYFELHFAETKGDENESEQS